MEVEDTQYTIEFVTRFVNAYERNNTGGTSRARSSACNKQTWRNK